MDLQCNMPAQVKQDLDSYVEIVTLPMESVSEIHEVKVKEEVQYDDYGVLDEMSQMSTDATDDEETGSDFLEENEECDDSSDEMERTTYDNRKTTRKAVPIIKIIKCTICNKAQLNKKAYIRHRDSHVSKFINESSHHQYECSECHEKFQLEQTLKCHARIVHQADEQLKCALCKREFQSSQTLGGHVYAHTDQKEFYCMVCNKAHTCRKEYRRHIAYHVGFKKNEFECNLCNRSFVNSRSLNNHQQIFHSSRPFPCNLCGNEFTDKAQFIQHAKTHKRVGKHICHICPQRCRSTGELDRHVALHLRDVPYHCKICGRGFTAYSSLQRHFQVYHKENKLYDCDFDSCHRIYANAVDLQEHWMIAHETNPDNLASN